MTASKLSISLAVLMVIVGMGWGIAMAISGDHSTSPAHAHLNLLGWVSLFLMGLYYRWDKTRDLSRLAKAQVVLWAVATATMVAGIALIHSGTPQGEPLAAVSALVLFADMLVFGWIVLGGTTTAAAQPAE